MKRIFFLFLLVISSNVLLAQNTWPVPKFNFLVTMEGVECTFQEVNGLEAETQVIEYRGGSSKVYSTIKMPGLKKYSSVTMKKGIAKKDFIALLAKAKTNTFNRTTLTIKLMDENGETIMTWTISNAWPVKFSISDLSNDEDEVSIESIEFIHEGISILNGK